MSNDDTKRKVIKIYPLHTFAAENKKLMLIYRLSSFSYSIVGLYGLNANLPEKLSRLTGFAGIRFPSMGNKQLGWLLMVLQGPASYLNDSYAKLDCGEFNGIFSLIDVVIASFLTLTVSMTAWLKYQDKKISKDRFLRIVLLLIVLLSIPSLIVSRVCYKSALTGKGGILVEIQKRPEIPIGWFRKKKSKLSVKLNAKWCKRWLLMHTSWHVITPFLGIAYLHRASAISR